jgi:two-component system, OmpR family, sensor histidine kinase SenX3
VNEFLVNTLIAIAGISVGVLVGLLVGRAYRQDLAEELEAATSQDTVADTLEVLSTPAILLDGVNTITSATESAVALGFKQDAVLTQPELLQLAKKTRKKGEASSEQLEISVGLTAEKLFVNVRAGLLNDGKVLIAIEDLTESKRLDDTRRDFIANISHELKTPIGAISLLSEALIDSVDDPEVTKKFSTDLHREAGRLANLVQDIIELSRLQGTEVDRNGQIVDMASVVEEAVDRNQVLAAQRKVKVKVDTKNAIEVLGDRELLVTAIKNLVENAILYSDEGSQVGIGLRQKHGIAAVAVADSGVGIAPEHQDRIFERFYRADPSRSRQTGGTGLGLAIVKHVALKHRGEVQLFSQPGLGSTFTFRIPVAKQKLTTSKDDE